MFRNQQKQFLRLKQKYFQIPQPKQKKIFSNFLTQTKKNIFRFLDPNKKEKKIHFGFHRSKQDNYFCLKRGIFMTKSLLLFFSCCFSAGRLFRQQKVGHGNETKCFGISRNNSFASNKNIFRFLNPNKKNIFKFLDPDKKEKKFISDSIDRNKIIIFVSNEAFS